MEMNGLTEGDWTVSGDGKTISITKEILNTKGNAWFTPDSTDSNRTLQLTTSFGRETNSTAIRAKP